jgi:hypothetical protein
MLLCHFIRMLIVIVCLLFLIEPVPSHIFNLTMCEFCTCTRC